MQERFRLKPRHFVVTYTSVVLWVALGGCVFPQGKLAEPGTLHAGEVVQVPLRSGILNDHEIHELLKKEGLSDSDIVDGTVAMTRIYCCGPPSTSGTRPLLNRAALSLAEGDIVEFRYAGASALATVTRVLQHAGDSQPHCSWLPNDESLWAREIFCEWMPGEGWVKQTGVAHGWYKPAVAN